MTLNINLICDAYIIQVSDRRMVFIGSGAKLGNDKCNKAVIFNADDGIFTATFHGIGLKNGERVDMWLARQLAETGAVELPIAQALPLIAQSATEWFKTMPRGLDLRHSFVIAGWLTNVTPRRPVSYVVSNFILGDFFSHVPKKRGEQGLRMHTELLTARKDFSVVQFTTRRSLVAFQPFGMTEALEASDWEYMNELFRRPTSATPTEVEPMLVEVVRRAASRPIGRQGINKDVLSVVLLPPGLRVPTLYPNSGGAENFVPLYVWNEQGYNVVVGGGPLTASRDVRYKLGPDVVVGYPGGLSNQSNLPNQGRNEMGMFFLPVKAKFKTETKPQDDGYIKLAGIFWPKTKEDKEKAK